MGTWHDLIFLRKITLQRGELTDPGKMKQGGGSCSIGAEPESPDAGTAGSVC